MAARYQDAPGSVRQTELTIRLDRRVDGQVQYVRAVYTGERGALGIETEGRVPELIDTLAVDLLRGHGGPVETWLSGPGQPEVGEALFGLLFPEFAQVPGVLTALQLGPDAPPMYPIRVRIVTDERRWATLPWSLTTYKRQRLCSRDSRWTFEICADVVAPVVDGGYGDRRPRVLVYAPRSPSLDPMSHIGALRGMLASYDESYLGDDAFHHAETLDALRTRCRGRRVDIVYLFGHITETGGPRLTCSTGATAAFVDLRPDLARCRPSVVFINGCRAGSALAHSAAEQLAGRFDAVIAPVSTLPADSAAELAMGWFEHHVVGACSPTEALLHGQPDETMETGDWALPIAFTRHGGWLAHPIGHLRPEIAARLDRSLQRSLATQNVRELVFQDHDARVQVFVGLGGASNLVEKLGAHLRQHVAREVPEVHLSLTPLHLPDERHGFEPDGGQWTSSAFAEGKQRLDRLLCHALECDDPANLLARISDLCYSRFPGKWRVLWLDWGAYGERVGLNHGQRPALRPDCSPKTLGLWLKYHGALARRLAGSDFEHVRVVASIGLEKASHAHAPKSPLHHAGGIVKRMAEKLVPGLSTTLLPQLEAVDLADLRKSLRLDPHAKVPPEKLEAITAQLMKRLGRDGLAPYDELVEAIARGEREAWASYMGLGCDDDDDLPDF